MRSWMLMTCFSVALLIFSGCGSADKRDDVAHEMTVSVSQARTALEQGNLLEAERQARYLMSDEESAFDAVMILGEALLRLRKMEEFDRDISPPGKAYLIVQSERACEEVKEIMQSGSPVGKLVVLESLSYTAAFTPERERRNLFDPFVELLENMVNEDDRALGVLALDVLGGINISSSRAAIQRIVEGDDPLFSYLANAYLPVGEVEQRR